MSHKTLQIELDAVAMSCLKSVSMYRLRSAMVHDSDGE